MQSDCKRMFVTGCVEEAEASLRNGEWWSKGAPLLSLKGPLFPPKKTLSHAISSIAFLAVCCWKKAPRWLSWEEMCLETVSSSLGFSTAAPQPESVTWAKCYHFDLLFNKKLLFAAESGQGISPIITHPQSYTRFLHPKPLLHHQGSLYSPIACDPLWDQ